MLQVLYNALISSTRQHQWILCCLVIILYSNTLLNDFAVDDSIVIVKNEYVRKGIQGIPDILNKDTFRGFFKTEGKDKLVSGGRYRPLSLIIFALVFQLFGASAFIYHLLNIVAFGALVLVLYKLLSRLFENSLNSSSKSLAFLASTLFAVHPIHTECVANIKGLDEILALFFSLSSFYLILDWLQSKRIYNLIFALFLFGMGLFSKENSIAFLALTPIGLYLFRHASFQKCFQIFLYLLLPTFIFLYSRAQILGWNPIAGQSLELMNNPFLKYVNGRYIPFTSIEKLGTIFYTLLRYIGLLIIPFPLCYDYYPKQIPIQSLFSPIAFTSLLLYTFFLFSAIKYIKSKPFFSFSIFCFLIPLFIVSNLLFSVGTFMGERFLFMPSLGFCLFTSFWFLKWTDLNKKMSILTLISILVIFGGITISRNQDWKDDLSLIQHDIKISPNSAKLNTAVGGIFLEKFGNSSNSNIQSEKIKIAKAHLNKAIQLHPLYFEAYNLLGNAHFISKEYKDAISKYEFILKYKPADQDALSNLALSYRELGRITGMNENNPSLAIQYLVKAIQLKPKDEEAISLLGVAYGVMGQYDKAVEIFTDVLKINPKSSNAYFNLYLTYLNKGDKTLAEENLSKAKLIDPDVLNKFNKMGK